MVSVCVANYNGIDTIGPCIDSILNQETDIEIEILVHDDASTDQSCEYIRDRYPDIKLIESTTNVGYCISNNKLALEATGQYLLFLNNDATLFPDAIQCLVAYTNSTSRPCLLGLPQYDMKNHQLIDRGYFFDPFLNPVANLDSTESSVGMVIGACLWIPKSIWDETGGFPEWFESLSEDMYICLNACIKGYDIHVLDKSGYYHLVGGSFGGGKLEDNRMVTTIRRRQLSERNKSFVMFLMFPGALLYLIFPLHLTLLLVEGILLALVKRDYQIFSKIYLNIITSIWKKRTFLIKSRKKLQSYRRISALNFLSLFVFYPYKLKMLIKHGLPTLK